MLFQGLILDYGEVLVDAQSRASLERLASIARLPVDEFVVRYWHHRTAYDRGLPAAEYWLRVLEGSAILSASRLADLIDADAASWMHYREDVWSITAEFRRRGGRTALLSNGVPEIVERVRIDRPLDAYFDVVVVSCEVGCSKPAPEIYRICLERLGVPAPSTLFVDDRVENLRAAERAGLRTLLFTGAESVDTLARAVGLH